MSKEKAADENVRETVEVKKGQGRHGMTGPLMLMIAGAGLIFGYIIMSSLYAIVLGGFSTATTTGTVERNVVTQGLVFFNNSANQLGTSGTLFGLVPLAGIALLVIGGIGFVGGNSGGKGKRQ